MPVLESTFMELLLAEVRFMRGITCRYWDKAVGVPPHVKHPDSPPEHVR